jgi:hypothetical protein
VKTLQDLRAIAELLPPGGAVTLPREALLEALAEVQTSALGAPLTVAQIAVRLHRTASTVRGWCETGRFAGAFKLNGRDWRVPAPALEAFESEQRAPAADVRPLRRSDKQPRRTKRGVKTSSLGDWQRERSAR